MADGLIRRGERERGAGVDDCQGEPQGGGRERVLGRGFLLRGT